jgi:pimeloyl-ACP methyl ester carboxylesterase
MNALTKPAILVAAATLARAALADGAYAPVDGHEVWYEVHGDLASGETPALLLHGGMMSIATTWAEIAPELAATRPVIAVDQQGHGRTGDRPEAITLETMRADTLGVLDHLGVERAHVVGFSLGGMLGIDRAVNAPDRVETLTVLSASQNIEGMLPEIYKMNSDPSFRPSPEVAALMPTEDDFAMMMEGFAENPSGPDVFGATMGKLSSLLTGEWGWSDEELAGIEAPVLIAIGDNDFVLPEHAAHMAAAIPNADLAVLPDTTHMTIITRPALLPMIEAQFDRAD